jgi:hypothetical protein
MINSLARWPPTRLHLVFQLTVLLWMLSTVLNRDIIVHVAFTEPQRLRAPTSSNAPPVQVAYYDGLNGGEGHYKAVIPCGQQSLTNTLTNDKPVF